MPEIGLPDAGGQDEVVVAELDLLAQRPPRQYPAPIRIDAGRLGDDEFCTRVSKNGRRAATSKPRMFASASPIRTAAMSPASSRAMSQAAATPTTTASWLLVPRTSPRLSVRRQNHSTATPTIAPATPMATETRNCPSW